MTEEEHKIYIEEMKKVIEQTITTVVNGKINKLDSKVSEYINSDLKWKEEKVEPLIDAHRTILNMATFIKWVAGVVTAFVVIWKVLTFNSQP